MEWQTSTAAVWKRLICIVWACHNKHPVRFVFQGGAIIFIDELDAIGTKRFGGEQSGDREVQRTMLELLNQLDGFSSNDKIKVQTELAI